MIEALALVVVAVVLGLSLVGNAIAWAMTRAFRTDPDQTLRGLMAAHPGFRGKVILVSSAGAISVLERSAMSTSTRLELEHAASCPDCAAPPASRGRVVHMVRGGKA
jgi:energy-converting hydrogenase Eha subunit H